MDQRNLISSIVFFCLATFVLITSIGLGIGRLNNPQPGFLLFWISLLSILFSLILSGIAYRNQTISVRIAHLWHNVRWEKNACAVAALAVYVLLLPSLGYLIATSLLMIILFRLGAMKIRAAVLSSLLSTGFSYWLFSIILKTPLPHGLWGF